MATGGVKAADGGSEDTDSMCSPCLTDGRSVQACDYCIECKDLFCKKCLKHHRKFRSLKDHRIVDLATMGTPGAQQSVSLPTEMCVSHPGKLIDMFCGTHDVVCCPACIAIEHRPCTGVDYLPNVVKGIDLASRYITLEKSIQNTKAELDTVKTAREEDLRHLEKEKHDVVTSIREFKDRIIRQLEEMESMSSRELQAKYDSFVKRIKHDVKTAEEEIMKMQRCLKELRTAFASKNETQQFIYVKTAEITQTDASSVIHGIEKHIKRESMSFNVNTDFEEYITSLVSLGEFTDNSLYSAFLHDRFTVKVDEDDKVCHIFGSCQLDDGSIILADFNNQNLKRINKSYKVVDHCKMPGGLWGVCVTSPWEVAVTLRDQKRIQFVSVGDRMYITRSFDVGSMCRGVACHKGRLFVTCCGDEYEGGTGRIKVYDKSHTLVKTIQTDTVGDPLASRPHGIMTSSDGTKLFIADRKEGLITLNTLGLRKCSLKNGSDFNGVCLEENGQVFVCGWGSTNITHLSNEGVKLGKLLSDKDSLKKPQSLCYDRINSRLIVASRDCNAITVFNLFKT